MPGSPAPFACVRCGAPLVLPHDPSVLEVTCSFCQTQTPVPSEHLARLRGGREAALRMSSGDGGGASGARAGCVVAAIVALVVLAAGAGVVFFTVSSRSAAVVTPVATAVTALPAVPATGTSTGTGAPALGTKVGSFGGKGTGPGFYEDARTIAVAPDGTVYVGEYDSGRVLQWDASGAFARAIDVPPSKDGRKYDFGLAVDTTGALWVSRAHEIVKLSPAGAIVTTIHERARPDRKKALPDEMCAHAIALDASNHIYTASDCTPEGMSVDIDPPYSLVKLDEKGKQLGHWRDAGVFESMLAVDGDGTAYVTGDMESQVTVWDPNGKLVAKWGQKGSDPGDFPSSVDGIGVDGHGHVLVLGSDGVKVYDVTGKFRGALGDKDGGRGMAVSAKGLVYVLRNDGPVDEYRLMLAP